MQRNLLFFTISLTLLLSGACQNNQNTSSEVDRLDYSIFQPDNLVAWCVVPFDSVNRGPESRAAMLEDLGFKKFAYDWREQHLPSFPEEVSALNEHGIELTAVWWWIDGQGDQLLNEGNQRLLHYLDSLNISCDIWMSFADSFFEGLDDSQKLEKAVEAISELNQLASRVNCRLMLYNHGAWFGDPRNQVEIIQKSGIKNIGLVYNFHHAHQQVEDFPMLLDMMLPYLNTVNINGMNKQGPKILTVGAGNLEKEMLKVLAKSGFKGHIGIIGHLEQEDVQLVLARNLKGLQLTISEF